MTDTPPPIYPTNKCIHPLLTNMHYYTSIKIGDDTRMDDINYFNSGKE